MKRALYTVLLVASACIAFSHYKQILKDQELQVTPAQVEWLNKRLALEAEIRETEQKLANLEARYAAIPQGAPYHTPWASMSDIRAYLSATEQDPKFKKSCKCERIKEDTRIFCRDWQRAKSDQARWYALTKLSVEISAVRHDLIELKISAGQMGDNIPEVKRQLMKYVGRA